MSLTNKGPAKSKSVTWSRNSAYIQYSGNVGVGVGLNEFPWSFLHVTHGLVVFQVVFRPLMVQYFNGISVNVELTPPWQTLSCVFNIKIFVK